MVLGFMAPIPDMRMRCCSPSRTDGATVSSMNAFTYESQKPALGAMQMQAIIFLSF